MAERCIRILRQVMVFNAKHSIYKVIGMWIYSIGGETRAPEATHVMCVCVRRAIGQWQANLDHDGIRAEYKKKKKKTKLNNTTNDR